MGWQLFLGDVIHRETKKENDLSVMIQFDLITAFYCGNRYLLRCEPRVILDR